MDKDIVLKIETVMNAKAKEYKSVRGLVEGSSPLKIKWDIAQQHVTHLRIESCSLDLSPLILQLSKLEWLSIKNCKIGKEPIWIDKMIKLRHITISHCGMVNVPKQILCLENLSSLALTYNSLNTIPREISKLKGLEILSFAGNDSYLELPETIKKLKLLMILNISYCKLESIPMSLIKLGLPFEIDNKPKATGILLYNSIIKGTDLDFFKQPRELIEAYYKGKKRTVKECKVIFLGDGEAGKSCIIERILTNKFDDKKEPTEGINILNKNILLTNGENIHMRLLDFGGQEIFHAMHRCFMSKNTIYVVVYWNRDDSDIDREVARWLETINSFAPDCPVIIALNKSDLSNFKLSVNERNLNKVNPNLKYIIETSAANGNGIDKLTKAISREISNQIKYLSEYNSSWLAIKKDMESMTADYIDDKDYRDICRTYDVTSRNIQNQILDWFMELGVVYHYHSCELDNRLEDLKVLSPKWLTNGIYRLILRTPENNGVLSHESIKTVLKATHSKDILPDKEYSPIETEFILHVMRSFQISHDMGDGKELIPLKMTKNGPKDINFNFDTALHLSWEANYLPNTIIHRLMVQKFNELVLGCMWLTGARFYDALNSKSAFVEMRETVIDVYINGISEKRIYMEEFRKIIIKILNELNIHYTEKLYCKVDGQVGSISYLDAIMHLCNDKQEIYISNIKKFVNPRVILQECYLSNILNYEKRQQQDSTSSTQNNIFVGNDKSTFVISNYNKKEYRLITNEDLLKLIDISEEIPQSDFEEILTHLQLINNSNKLSFKYKFKSNNLIKKCKDKTTSSSWKLLKEFLLNASVLATITDVSITHGPQFLNLLKRIFV